MLQSKSTEALPDGSSPRNTDENALKEQILNLRNENETLKSELRMTNKSTPEMVSELQDLIQANSAMENALTSAHRCCGEVWKKHLIASKDQTAKANEKIEAVSDILNRLQTVLTKPSIRSESFNTTVKPIGSK
eukprot:CFRG7558T1